MPERLHIAGMPGDGHSPHPAASPRVRVAIADDHGLMRRSLRRLLEDSDDIEVLVEIGDPAGAAEQVCRARPDVLVLDLGMPDAPGLQLIGSIRERVPETQIVVVTMDDSPLSAQRALAAGAIGFVTKEHAASQLEEAVRAAARGE
ncbi:MAG: response regulator transcription factor, partial [Acidobacteriota bacterium]|nr:response regulator transcription factor [Acidobacteriota bacterium]